MPLTISGDGTISGSPLSISRNLLHNGAMQVHQRGTSKASITMGGYYTADRWSFTYATLGTWTQSIENDAPLGSGFRKSLKMLVTTADAAPDSGDLAAIVQSVEGQNLQVVAKGTSLAKALTVSFWVKSNVTGTFVVWALDMDSFRSVSASYTVSVANTWEKKTITLPADTTGVWDNDAQGSLNLYFVLGGGSSYTSGTLNTTWSSYSGANAATGQTNLAATINNYWQITGVQLEAGPVATAFEFKSYDMELAECQRYYWRITTSAAFEGYANGHNGTTTQHLGCIKLPQNMRIAPTSIETTGTASNYIVTARNVNTACSSVPTLSLANTSTVTYTATVASGLTAGDGSMLRSNAAGYLGFSADL